MKNHLATAKLVWQPRIYDPHLDKWLHRIDVPTLLVWGDERPPVAEGICGGMAPAHSRRDGS